MPVIIFAVGFIQLWAICLKKVNLPRYSEQFIALFFAPALYLLKPFIGSLRFASTPVCGAYSPQQLETDRVSQSKANAQSKPYPELKTPIFSCPEPCRPATRWHRLVAPQEVLPPHYIHRKTEPNCYTKTIFF